jgi:hypothetical protein
VAHGVLACFLLPSELLLKCFLMASSIIKKSFSMIIYLEDICFNFHHTLPFNKNTKKKTKREG